MAALLWGAYRLDLDPGKPDEKVDALFCTEG